MESFRNATIRRTNLLFWTAYLVDVIRTKYRHVYNIYIYTYETTLARPICHPTCPSERAFWTYRRCKRRTNDDCSKAIATLCRRPPVGSAFTTKYTHPDLRAFRRPDENFQSSYVLNDNYIPRGFFIRLFLEISRTIPAYPVYTSCLCHDTKFEFRTLGGCLLITLS